MSQQYPELVFVSGPQAGQRVVLSRRWLVLGRSGDILLSEEFASRHQARYELLPEGPSLENLSGRGTYINGKRYKQGKKVLLDTGDLLGIGKETEVLFVAAGVDPSAALAAFEAQAASRARDAFGRRVTARPAVGGEAAIGLQPPPPALPLALPARPARGDGEAELEAALLQPQAELQPSEMTMSQREAIARKRRQRNTLIGLGIWLGLIGAVAIVLSVSDEPTGPPEVAKLERDKVSEHVRAALDRTPNPAMRDAKLQEAVSLFRQYGTQARFLPDTVQAFKEAQAYSGRGYFESTEHTEMYRQTLEAWESLIWEKYNRACLLEKNRDWAQAEEQFGDLLRLIRDERNPVFSNVEEHYKRVKTLRSQKEANKRSPWM